MQSVNGYKAIFFDLDGTLRHSVPLGADVFTDFVVSLGLSVSAETKRKTGDWEHFYWASSSELRADVAKFDGDDHAFWINYTSRRLMKLGATPEQAAEFCPLVRQHMDEAYNPVNEVPLELHRVLPELRAAGYILAVLSNRRSSFEEMLKELAIDQYFDLSMAAGEIGSWKPDPKVFTPLLNHFDLKPEESVYIGDNYYADVIGARNAGLKPVLYDPRGIFPDADCSRMTSFDELGDFL